ncbi:MAG: hypothetical protein MRJ52_12065 [Nitrosomonas sp.]|nr:hypothetical protein [Nitrosomonas sp.]
MNGLDQEEQALLQRSKQVNSDGLRFAERKKRHQEYAEAMFRKDARINIKLSSRDLRVLQKKALAEGIPYQTLVASILHKYVEGRLHEERQAAQGGGRKLAANPLF